MFVNASVFLETRSRVSFPGKDGRMSKGLLLCIDDDEANLKVRELIFRSAGYDVVSTTSSHTGLGLFATREFDIVILDYRMPGLNGVEVAGMLRAMKPAIPILMLSGEFLDASALPDTVDGYVEKVTSPVELLSRVEEMVKLKKLRGDGHTGAA